MNFEIFVDGCFRKLQAFFLKNIFPNTTGELIMYLRLIRNYIKGM